VHSQRTIAMTIHASAPKSRWMGFVCLLGAVYTKPLM
jgi:hypothetical protein